MSDVRIGAARAGELTIGEMSRDFGVTFRTLRFYEEKELLQPRREGTARFYGDRDRVRLALVLKGRKLGFTLVEIFKLIDAEERGGDLPSDIVDVLTPAQVDARIAELEGVRERAGEAILALRNRALSPRPAVLACA